MTDFDPDDDEEDIRQKAEARAIILEARAKMHPVAQVVTTILEHIGRILENVGCLLIILIIILLLLGPNILEFLR